MRYLPPATCFLPPCLLALALFLTGCAEAPAGGTPTQPPATQAVVVVPTELPTAAPTAVPTEPPTAAPTVVPTEPPTAAPTTVPTAAPAPVTPVPGGIGEEILFLRGGRLIALDVAATVERVIADQVRDFAATPDGRLLALVRGDGLAAEIWVVGRDGAGLRQITRNDRAELGLSWAPDGLSLAYTSSTGEDPRPYDWDRWSRWCLEAEARLIDLVDGAAELSLGAGCEPAFAPDGRRIAFSAAPADAQLEVGYPSADNSVRIVNRQGQNGWDFAAADGAGENGYIVYAPAWSPDAGRLAYQRFLGYQALVDINLTELGDSFRGAGRPIGIGAGWMRPPIFSPDGRSLLVIDHNFSDARGFQGYDVWGITALRLGERRMITLPSREIEAEAALAGDLARVTGAVWSPDGAAIAVLLPAGWRADATDQEPVYSGEGPGEIWRWRPGAPPEARIVEGVDFGSPLAWLATPPDLAVIQDGLRLAYPREWGVREPEGPGELFAGPRSSLIGIAGFNLPPAASPAEFFPRLVPADAELSEPISWPDGSIYRSFKGVTADGVAVAGAVRTLPFADGSVAIIYRTDEARWPLERARAMALLAAGGLE